jgi:hypothetical protein
LKRNSNLKIKALWREHDPRSMPPGTDPFQGIDPNDKGTYLKFSFSFTPKYYMFPAASFRRSMSMYGYLYNVKIAVSHDEYKVHNNTNYAVWALITVEGTSYWCWQAIYAMKEYGMVRRLGNIIKS